MFIFPSNTGVTGYAINSAALFDGSTGYLSRTFGAGDRRTWTWSGWVTPSELGTDRGLFSHAVGSNQDVIYLRNSNKIEVYSFAGSFQWQLTTTALFRDTTGPLHIVVTVDTTQATASDRVKIFVNGVQVTVFDTSNYPVLNYQGQINNNVLHYGGAGASGPSAFYDGYMAETHFIDGQALSPTDFGALSLSTGRWEPKRYTGTYGTNGFYLKFEDGALGTDSSGNGNNWTVNGSVTAVTNTPTDVLNTLNPLDIGIQNGSSVTLSNGNRTFNGSNSVSQYRTWYSTLPAVTDKVIYGEMVVDSIGSVDKISHGIRFVDANTKAVLSGFRGDGTKQGGGAYGNAWNTSDVIGFVIKNGAAWWSINDTWQNGATLSEINSGDTTNAEVTGLTGSVLLITGDGSATTNSSLSGTFRFEETDWTGTAPNGSLEWSVANLTQDAITSGTSRVGFSYTGGTPSNISGPTVTAIYGTGFVASNAVAFTCDVDNPIGGDVMPRGQAN